mgnify:CR=1 FL=1
MNGMHDGPVYVILTRMTALRIFIGVLTVMKFILMSI